MRKRNKTHFAFKCKAKNRVEQTVRFTLFFYAMIKQRAKVLNDSIKSSIGGEANEQNNEEA